MRQLVIAETPEDVADAAADLIFESQSEAIQERGSFRIALSGGHTPRLLFDVLAGEEWNKTMSWEEWEVFWADERAVPPDHADSNYRLAHETLLSKVAVGDVWRIRGEAPDLTEAAAEYARAIRSRFGPGAPVFDTILLGMGRDGHTASLFPGHAAIESGSIVETVEVTDWIPRRLTLTLPVLNHARRVIFMVTGAEKAETVHRIFEEEDTTLPAARVLPLDGDCWWILDEAAAGRK